MKTRLYLKFALLLLCFSIISNVYASGYGMQERIHKRITIIHKLLGNGKYSDAITRLGTLSDTVKNMPYEKAVVLQLYGYVYSQKGETEKAIAYFEQCLQLKSLPEDSMQNIRLNIMQLHLDKKQYQKAEGMYLIWQSSRPNSADGYAQGGVVYALQKRYHEAEQALSKAIQLTESPKEEWLQALLSIYLDSKKYNPAAELLEKLVILQPDKKQYWIQLADVSFMLKRNKKAASVLEIALQKNYLTTGDEYKKLAAFHYYNNTPLKSAKVLEIAISKKILDAGADNYKLLAYYFLNAKESDQAAKYLGKAVTINNDLSLQFTIAQLYFEKQQWQKAQEALKPLLKSNNTVLRDKAEIMSGIIYFELKQYEQALTLFKTITPDSELYIEANSWKQYMTGLLDYRY